MSQPPTADDYLADTVTGDHGGLGALVIHTESDLEDVEIEISRTEQPAELRMRTPVLARRNRHGAQHSAVFHAVPAGSYVIWRDATTPHGVAVVAGGLVTDYHWDWRGLVTRRDR